MRDHDAERRRKAIEAQRLLEQSEGVDNEPDPISTPGDRRGNGRKWWRETWGKGVGGVITLVLGALVWWAWGLAVSLKAATVEVYSLPPVVRQHDMQIRALQVQAGTVRQMTQPEIEAMAKALAAEMKKR